MIRKYLKVFATLSIITTMLVGCGNAEQTSLTNEIGAVEETLTGNTDISGEETDEVTNSDADTKAENILGAIAESEITESVENDNSSEEITSSTATEQTKDNVATTEKATTSKENTETTSKKQNVTSKEETTTAKKETETTTVKKEPETTAHTHSYSSKVTKKATCTTTGIKTYTCSCGNSYTENIAKTAHTSSEWIVTDNATCSASGSKHQVCTVCNTELEVATIESNGTHNLYWDGNDTTRTRKCHDCSYTGITEYQVCGNWGYYDDDAATELWGYVNGQRNATQTLTRDPEGNPIEKITVPSLIEDTELMALAKTRAAEVATNFNHGGYGDECLAGGQGTAFEAFSAWYLSVPHIKAITDPEYISGGVTCFWYDADGSGINLYPIWVLEMSRD